MEIGFFTMPLHPAGSDLTETLDSDLDQIVTLDALGYREAWIGEHFTAGWENLAAPDLLIAKAIPLTKNIILGTGVSCLPDHDPFVLAHRIAVLDHLAKGRFYCAMLLVLRSNPEGLDMSAKTVSTALLILVTLLFFNVAEARTSESALPGGCLASGFKHGGGEVVLNPDSEKQGLFLLHNISSETFQVTHPVGGGTASAGWTSEIGPGRWSAFATDSKAFTLSCMKPVDGGVNDPSLRRCAESMRASES